MEFKKIDFRSRDEAGVALHLVHPETGAPLGEKGKPATVFVRGSFSATVQEKIRVAIRDAKSKGKSKDDATVIECMEDVLLMQMRECKPFISRFENVVYDGRDPNEDEEEMDAVLCCFLPRMSAKKNKKGEPVLDGDGSPEFEIHNNTFPAQILAFVEKLETERGNASSA